MIYPKVSIIILNWNGLENTIECLENLKKIIYPNYEVIVVDNGSKENEADVLEKKYRGYIEVIKNKENLGYAEGNNIGIRHAFRKNKPANFVFLLNNDAIIEADCLNVCIEVARLSKAGIVGTLVKRIYNDEVVFWGTPPQPIRSLLAEFFGLSTLIHYNSPSPLPVFWEVGRIQGCAIMISSALLSKIKKDGYYLNPNFFLYCEEPDLCFRARKIGYKIVMARGAFVHHYFNKSMGPSPLIPRYYLTRNKIFLANAVLPWYLKIFFHPWYVLIKSIYILKTLVGGKPKVALTIFQGLYDGYKGVKGKWIMHKG